MILHCFESARPARRWMGLPACWSAGAHGALVFFVVGGAAATSTVPDDPAPEREVVYLLPVLPGASHAPDGGSEGRLAFQGPGTEAPTPSTGLPLLAPAGGGRSARRAREASDGQVLAPSVPADDSSTAAGAAIYLEAELDSPVERTVESAGPAYPDSLRLAGVEGQVIAEWVVDTAGTADAGTFRVVSSTHPQFTVAVREVLPAMRFHPAVLNGRNVRQLVRQAFQFRIAVVQAPRELSAGDAARP